MITKVSSVSSVTRDQVVLVDEDDNELGTLGKLEAHQRPLLHRAISVLIFDEQGRFLVQQRAGSKYHAPLLWANACCTHPRPGEKPLVAAQRRVHEELGIKVPLMFDQKVLYAVRVGDLYEYELSHIFVGRMPCGTSFEPNPREVSQVRWLEVDHLFEILAKKCLPLAPWFQVYLGLWGENYLKNLFQMRQEVPDRMNNNDTDYE